METETQTPDTTTTETCWNGCGQETEGNACPNSPDVCADCCPCHGDDVQLADLADPRPLRMPSNAARAIGAFNPDVPTRYVAAGAGHHLIRDTRAEAEADWISAQYGIPPRNIGGHLLVMCKTCDLAHYDVPGGTLHGP